MRSHLPEPSTTVVPPIIPADQQSVLNAAVISDSVSRLSRVDVLPVASSVVHTTPLPSQSASQLHVADWKSHLSSVSTASQAIKRSSQYPSA